MFPTYCLSSDVNTAVNAVPSRLLGKHNTALSAPHENYGKSNQGFRGPTQGASEGTADTGQSVKGNSCQCSSHLHYFREQSKRVLDLLQQQTLLVC